MTTPLIWLIPLFLSFAVQAKAYNLYSPEICKKASLQLINPSSEDLNLGFSYYDDTGSLKEEWLHLKSTQKRLLTAEDLPRFPFHITSPSESLLAFSVCDAEFIPWSYRTQAWRRWTLKEEGTYQLHIQNLNPKKQSLMLRFYGEDGHLLKTQSFKTLSYRQSSELKFPAEAKEFELVGEGRIATVLRRFHEGQYSLVPENKLGFFPVKTSQTARYFLMKSSDQKDSFVIQIEDPQILQKALDIIRSGEWKLMVGDISYQPLSENRSLLHGDRSPYSWRVEKVINFNDFAHVSCNGDPQGVEDNIFSWLQKKRICFWSFYLDREVSAQEVQQGFLKP